MLPNLLVNSCIKMNVKYNLPAADLECCCKAARNYRSLFHWENWVEFAVGSPSTAFIHAEVIRLLIKLCRLLRDASFSNSLPAWVNKHLIHLLPSPRLVVVTLNTGWSRWKGGNHGQYTDCRGVQLLVCINLHSKAVFILGRVWVTGWEEMCGRESLSSSEF